jgi:osmotically-inducible protein OsmY
MRSLKICSLILAVILLQGCVAAAVVTVVGSASAVNDRRSIGHQIDDQTIELNAHAALREHKELKDNANVQIVSVNGTVLAVGQVANNYIKDIVVKTINNIDGVLQFHDQLKIATPTSILTKTNDLWLTTKVKTALFGGDKLDATNIKVVTENGEVFLMGIVSQGEANEAIEIARHISGVSRVYNAFQLR